MVLYLRNIFMFLGVEEKPEWEMSFCLCAEGNPSLKLSHLRHWDRAKAPVSPLDQTHSGRAAWHCDHIYFRCAPTWELLPSNCWISSSHAETDPALIARTPSGD